MRRSFTIDILDDNIVECIETFKVTISSVTTCGVTIGSVSDTEVRITDDDGTWRFISNVYYIKECYWSIGATVSLSRSQYSVSESDASLSVTITLSSVASEDVLVEVTISDGSATGNVEQ